MYSTFKTDMIRVVLVLSISNFFTSKNSQGRKLSVKKIPSSGNSALGNKNENWWSFEKIYFLTRIDINFGLEEKRTIVEKV